MSLKDRVIKLFLFSPLLASNPERRDVQCNQLRAVLNCNIRLSRAPTSQILPFYFCPREENVKAIVAMKIKCPIYEDESFEMPSGRTKTKTKDPMHLMEEIRQLSEIVERLRGIAASDTSTQHRRRAIHVMEKSPKIVGHRYFLIVVIKSGILKKSSTLEYFIPELPIYEQTRVPITVQSIIDLDHRDVNRSGSSRETDWRTQLEDCSLRVRDVESVTVNHSIDLESIALLEVPSSCFVPIKL